MIINKCGSPNGVYEIHVNLEELKELQDALNGSAGEYTEYKSSRALSDVIEGFLKTS